MKTNVRSFRILAIAALFAVLGSVTARAQYLYSQGHGDIRISYTNGVLSQNYSLDGGARIGGNPFYTRGEEDSVFAPDEVITFIPDITVARPEGAEWDFLGAPAGAPLYYIPEVQEGDRPWLGTSSETLDYPAWTNLTVQLTAMTGPPGAHFSLFDSGLFDGGQPNIITSDGITDADTFISNVGSHAHFNWMFTQPGLYTLTFLIRGEHLSDGVKTTTATYTFRITPPAPYTLVESGGTLALDIGEVQVKSVGPAAIDGLLYSRTAFRLKFSGAGATAANDSGLAVHDLYGAYVLRVREGDIIGDSGTVKFSSFGDPALDDEGTIYFTAQLAGEVSDANDEVLVRNNEAGNDPTVNTILARKGDPAPGLAKFKFGRVNWFIAAPNGVLYFSASAVSGKAKKDSQTRTGVWRAIRAGAPQLVAATGQPLVEGGNEITHISLPTIDGRARNQSRAVGGNGALTLRLTYQSGTHAIVRFPSPLP